MGTLLAATVPAGARTWTNTFGRSFEADFVRMDGSHVIFTLSNGRGFSTPLAELSAGDQAALRGVGQGAAEVVASNFGRPWPQEIRLEGAVACKVVSEDGQPGQAV